MTSVVADFDAVDEMNADGPARKGRKVDAGLAVKKHGLIEGGNYEGGEYTSQSRRGCQSGI